MESGAALCSAINLTMLIVQHRWKKKMSVHDCTEDMALWYCSTGVTQVVGMKDLLVLLRAFFAGSIGSIVTFNHSTRTEGKYGPDRF